MQGKITSSKYAHLTAENFREYFEQAYRKEIAWRNRNGSLSFEEFQGIAGESGVKVKDKHKQQAYLEYKERELYLWGDAALTVYRQKLNIPSE